MKIKLFSGFLAVFSSIILVGVYFFLTYITNNHYANGGDEPVSIFLAIYIPIFLPIIEMIVLVILSRSISLLSIFSKVIVILSIITSIIIIGNSFADTSIFAICLLLNFLFSGILLYEIFNILLQRSKIK